MSATKGKIIEEGLDKKIALVKGFSFLIILGIFQEIFYLFDR
jgi:hypothetical protein